MTFTFKHIIACRVPGNDSFDSAFAQWLKLQESERAVSALLRTINTTEDAKKFINELIESGLLCDGPYPGSFQSADLNLTAAEQVWNFYEIRRGIAKHRLHEAPSLFQ